MNKLKYSLIIPLYNVQEYVHDLVDNIIKIENSNLLEVIFVDDVCEDDTVNMLESLLVNYEYKILRHKKNSGLGAARNTGLKTAVGEYVYFLDSDDYLVENIIEIFEYYTKTYKYDSYIFTNKRVSTYEPCTGTIHVKPFEGNQNNFFVYRDFSCCIRLFKREIFKKVKFPSGYYEDLFMVMALSKYNFSCLNTGTCVYNYRYNEVSIMNSSFSKEKLRSYIKICYYAYMNLPAEKYTFILHRVRGHIKLQTEDVEFTEMFEKFMQRIKFQDMSLYNFWISDDIGNYDKACRIRDENV